MSHPPPSAESAARPPRPAIRVIGLGNEYRSDDAVGILLARQLRGELPAEIEVIEASGEGAALLDAWRDASSVILIDAVHSGAQPGTVHRLDAQAQRIPTRFFRYSTHAFSVAEAVELARALRQLPPGLLIYGIEGKDFSAREGLSPEVARAATAVARRVREELQSLTRQ